MPVGCENPDFSVDLTRFCITVDDQQSDVCVADLVRH